MKKSRSRRGLLAAGLLLASQSMLLPSAFAQTGAQAGNWPNRPVRMVVPFPAGGSTDLVARYIAKELSEKLGQQFVVDNRTGASGNIGTDAVAKAAPDGYTIGLVTSGPLVNNKFLFKTMPFDPERDLTPVALVCEIPMVFAANPTNPAKSLTEFVVNAKSPQTAVSVGMPGNGTVGHLTLEALKLQNKLSLNGIPYRGDIPGMTDLLGGSVDAVVGPITAFIPNLRAGKLRGLAVTSAARFPGLPDIPTAKEQGINLNATVWLAVVAPAQLPQSIVQTLNTEINRILNSPQARERLTQQGAVVSTGAPQLIRERIGAEGKFWQQVIQTANVKMN